MRGKLGLLVAVAEKKNWTNVTDVNNRNKILFKLVVVVVAVVATELKQ